MKLWEHPRLMGALCAAAVLACAAMPAAFLAVTDAAYIGRVVPVAAPYTAPTPTADDYYILRQLAARRQDSAMLPRTEEPTAPGTPKMYIGASASLQSMSYADAATADAAEQALQRLADCGVLPGDWAVQQDTAADEDSSASSDTPSAGEPVDEMLAKAIELAVDAGQVSISMLQRRLRVGYARAGRLVDEMTLRGITAEAEGPTKPRTVLISREEWRRMQENQE